MPLRRLRRHLPTAWGGVKTLPRLRGSPRRSRGMGPWPEAHAPPALVLGELCGYDAEVEQLVTAQHRHRKLCTDLGLDHQPLEVACLAHADAANRDDDVARAQLATSGGRSAHDLVNLHAGLAR